jgi:broad specificity phosphatase PhoE
MLNLNNLKHKYYVMRHGHSEPQAQNITVCQYQNAIKSEFGLTQKGREQSKVSSKLFELQMSNVQDLIIIHSPYSRAVETANIFAKELGINIYGINENLVERDFGDIELTLGRNANNIWLADKTNSDSNINNSESLNKISNRMLKVIEDCENLDEEYGQNIVLVGHSESFFVLETAFRKMPVTHHRDIPHIRNAEIRALN